MKNRFLFIVILLITLSLRAQSTSALLGYDADGKLTYVTDAKGNRIPDFSYVGYHHNEKEIPNIPIKKIINPVVGDNLNHIQRAIDELEALLPDANGYRGTLLLKAGSYEVSDVLRIERSGIVIRGEGKATVLTAMKKEKSDFIVFQGSSDAARIESTKKKITDSYVPVGARTVTVESGHTFAIGDPIMVERKPNQAWIKFLGMDKLTDTDANDTNWTPSSYTIRYRRKVVHVEGNKITIDAPIVDLIDPIHAEGFIYKYTWTGKIEEVGIENIQLNSFFASEEDENHAWNAVTFRRAENGWAKKVYANFFAYACVDIERSSMKITVDECEMRNPKSRVRGGLRYSFNVDGEQNLVKNCITDEGRHDFVTGSRVAGPNVFLKSTALNAKSDTGPHHRWAAGILFDNIDVFGNHIRVQNRLNSGSGHGWSGVSIMFWNSKANISRYPKPPGDHTNWAIGNEGRHRNDGVITAPFGYVESVNTHINPESLFEKQLKDRLEASGIVLSTNNIVKQRIKAYPNPSTGNFEIFVPNNSNQISIEIYNINSQLLVKRAYQKSSEGKIFIDMKDKPNGIYFVKVNLKQPVFMKLIKN